MALAELHDDEPNCAHQGVTASIVLPTALPANETPVPATLIPVLTTAPVTEIAAPAAAPATLTTAQPEPSSAAAQAIEVVKKRRAGGVMPRLSRPQYLPRR